MSLARQLSEVLAPEELGSHAQLADLPIARPRSAEQAQEILRMATRDSVPLVLIGRGNKLGWSLMAAAPQFALSTRELRGVLDFEPGDGVLTAMAGTPMDELARVAAVAGLGLTPCVARPSQATLGGVICAGQSGIDRELRGATRLHVLGIDSLQVDGTQTRSGGRLVKNVSGYDLHRLLTGSFGSLALVLQASLRLFPLPQAHCHLSRTAARLQDLLALLPRLREALSAPHGLLLECSPETSSWKLQLLLAGREAPLELERECAERVLGECEVVSGSCARDDLDRLRDLSPDAARFDVLHVGTRRTRLGETMGVLQDALGASGAARIVAQPAIASFDVGLASGSVSAQSLQELRALLAPLGAQLSLRRRAPLQMPFACTDTDSVRTRLSNRLREAYDPARLLCTRPPLGAWS